MRDEKIVATTELKRIYVHMYENNFNGTAQIISSQGSAKFTTMDHDGSDLVEICCNSNKYNIYVVAYPKPAVLE